MGVWFEAAPALAVESAMDPGELARLIGIHSPASPPQDIAALDVAEKTVRLPGQAEATHFVIYGFEAFGCRQCHEGEALLDSAVSRMTTALARLKEASPETPAVPLRQYLIQSWSDPLLSAGQLAHATFDAIRLFPASILVDTYAYGLNTHVHESLHLAQDFLGPANELEAYALNARFDPGFLLLNYPYFENVMQAFFAPEFPEILKRYYDREVRDMTLPQEAQWFLNPFEEDSLSAIAEATRRMEPLLKGAADLNRRYPLQAAMLSEQTGIPSLLLDIVAARSLPLPPLTISADQQEQAFEILRNQMEKTDNLFLGYRVDRKKEALMHLQLGLKIKDAEQRTSLYFHFLNRWDATKEGLSASERLEEYVRGKLEGIERLLAHPGITEIEREGGRRFRENIEKRLMEIQRP